MRFRLFYTSFFLNCDFSTQLYFAQYVVFGETYEKDVKKWVQIRRFSNIFFFDANSDSKLRRIHRNSKSDVNHA